MCGRLGGERLSLPSSVMPVMCLDKGRDILEKRGRGTGNVLTYVGGALLDCMCDWIEFILLKVDS